MAVVHAASMWAKTGSTTEWGDGPFDHVDLVTGVHVALEPKDDVIPRLDVIP
jgi:hypothetical protein